MSPRKKRKQTRKADVGASSYTEQQKALRLVIMPESLVSGGGEGAPSTARRPKSSSDVVKLRNPKSGNAELYLMNRGAVYQLHQFVEHPRSWFVDETVCRDGKITLTTQIDPLFLILPYLNKGDKFRPLDQIVVDEELSEFKELTSCLDSRKLASIADVKECPDLLVYRFNMDKCLCWLKRKMNALQNALRNGRVHVSGAGAQAATFVRNKKEKAAGEDDHLRYAHGIISEYLPEDISEAFLRHLGLPASPLQTANNVEEPPCKRSRLDDQGPTEDYGTDDVNDAGAVPKKKLTVAQRALSKVDKTGMKSIASFFNKKGAGTKR